MNKLKKYAAITSHIDNQMGKPLQERELQTLLWLADIAQVCQTGESVTGEKVYIKGCKGPEIKGITQILLDIGKQESKHNTDLLSDIEIRSLSFACQAMQPDPERRSLEIIESHYTDSEVCHTYDKEIPITAYLTAVCSKPGTDPKSMEIRNRLLAEVGIDPTKITRSPAV